VLTIYDSGCSAELTESGVRATDEPDFAGALDACPDCDELVYIEVGPESACGYGVTNPVVRGIDWIGADAADIWNLTFDGSRWDATVLASDGEFDPVTDHLSYYYDADWYDGLGEVDLIALTAD
jgi:hypothetical protein